MKRRDELPEQSRAEQRSLQPSALAALAFGGGWHGTLQEKEKHSWKVQGWAALLLGETSGLGTRSANPHFGSCIGLESCANNPL